MIEVRHLWQVSSDGCSFKIATKDRQGKNVLPLLSHAMDQSSSWNFSEHAVTHPMVTKVEYVNVVYVEA